MLNKLELTWVGKYDEEKLEPRILIEDKEKSYGNQNTENMLIHGDNLLALKSLEKDYSGRIKCIYIDPPYNTGNDFIYNDNFYKSTEEELITSGRMDVEGNILISKDINNNARGRFHSDWLSMMYPRLKLARNLLDNNGMIFISIDDKELFNLKKICDEIFGEQNYLNTVSVNAKVSAGASGGGEDKR